MITVYCTVRKLDAGCQEELPRQTGMPGGASSTNSKTKRLLHVTNVLPKVEQMECSQSCSIYICQVGSKASNCAVEQ